VSAPGRVVLDPNVLVSAVITSSGTTPVITPVVSPALLTELTLVLRGDKFRAYLDLGAALAFVAEVERLAATWEDPDSDSTAESPREPLDAVAGRKR
jgi:predicted nucleic acid-binding protein